LIYLDNAATTFPKPEAVHQAMEHFARNDAGNPGRSGHHWATAASGEVEGARQEVARLIGAPDPSRVALCLNATDALSMAFHGILRPGDHVVTSRMEHNSVVRPLNALARAGLIDLDQADNDMTGCIDPDSLRRLMRPSTRLVAMTWASNAFGTIQPIDQIAEVVKTQGALLLLDASQAVGSIDVDVAGRVPIDLLAFPGHKGLMGPMGTGALYIRAGLDLAPWREGGTGGDSTLPVQPLAMPHRMEGGTPNAHGLAGLRAGCRWVMERGVGAIREHERLLAARLLAGLSSIDGVSIHGPAGANGRTGAISFTLKDLDPHDAAGALDATFGIAVRAGLHCAPEAHASLGTLPAGTVRASLGPFNTTNDVDHLIDALAGMLASTAKMSAC
jgi:cysteine desulfurase family protein